MNIVKYKKTYGVYNLIEWHALLRMGKATVKVPFTGGSITTQGITPATYTTEDPIIQFAIERSPEYSSGKIKLVRRVKLDGTVEIEHNIPKPIPIVIETKSDDSTAVTDGETGSESSQEDEETGSAVAEDEDSEKEECDKEGYAQEKQLVEMEFDNNDDAKDYLETTFGCIRSKLRNRADIIAAGKANGVEIGFN